MKYIRFNFVVTCNQWKSWVMLKWWNMALLHLAVTLGKVNLNRVKLGSAKFIRLGQPTLMARRVIVRQSLWSFFHEFAVLKPIKWTCKCKPLHKTLFLMRVLILKNIQKGKIRGQIFYSRNFRAWLKREFKKIVLGTSFLL